MAFDQFGSRFKRYLPKKSFDLLVYVLFALAILKLIDLYTDLNEHEDNWNEFKVEHHCQLKATAEGDIQSAWLCDDGKTYYRWRQLVK